MDTEIRDALKEFKEEMKSMLENHIQIIDLKFDIINKNFDKLEKKNNELEEDIKKLQVHSCPHLNRINELEKEVERQKNIKTFLNRLLIIAGSIVGLTFTAIKIYLTFRGE